MNIRKIILEEIDGFLDSTEEDWEWANKITPYIPKVGDKVKIKPGFFGGEAFDEEEGQYMDLEIDIPNYGGGGYEEFEIDEIFTIEEITLKDGMGKVPTVDNIFRSAITGREAWIIWSHHLGIWSDAVELVE